MPYYVRGAVIKWSLYSQTIYLKCQGIIIELVQNKSYRTQFCVNSAKDKNPSQIGLLQEKYLHLSGVGQQSQCQLSASVYDLNLDHSESVSSRHAMHSLYLSLLFDLASLQISPFILAPFTNNRLDATFHLTKLTFAV